EGANMVRIFRAMNFIPLGTLKRELQPASGAIPVGVQPSGWPWISAAGGDQVHRPYRSSRRGSLLLERLACLFERLNVHPLADDGTFVRTYVSDKVDQHGIQVAYTSSEDQAQHGARMPSHA